MKRFWRDTAPAPAPGGWQVELDGRSVKTQAGRAQIVPSAALAAALAAEWAAQPDEIDPAAFILRDLADHAIDVIAPDSPAAIAALQPYADTDTLLYRAEPGDPLAARQGATWEPLVIAAEHRWDIRFERVAGIVHRPQPTATVARLGTVLSSFDPFRLAALTSLTTLSASLIAGLAALAPDSDPAALWAAAELEEQFQAERWGRDAEAEARAARRSAAFHTAVRFARLIDGEQSG